MSYPSLFSRTCLVTLSLIPSELGRVFELGIQRLQALEELEEQEIQYSQSLSQVEREKKFTQHADYLIEALTFKATRITLSSPISLSLQSAVLKHKFYH